MQMAPHKFSRASPSGQGYGLQHRYLRFESGCPLQKKLRIENGELKTRPCDKHSVFSSQFSVLNFSVVRSSIGRALHCG